MLPRVGSERKDREWSCEALAWDSFALAEGMC